MTIISQVKQTLAILKGSHSTLRSYSLQTRDEKTKLVYNEALEMIRTIIDDLEKRVQTLEYQEPEYKGN